MSGVERCRHVSGLSLACDLDLLARAGAVDEVVQHDDLLVAGQATGRHTARALLEGQLLVVAVDGLRHIHLQLHQAVCINGRSA